MLTAPVLSRVFDISSVDDAVEILCTSHHRITGCSRIVA